MEEWGRNTNLRSRERQIRVNYIKPTGKHTSKTRRQVEETFAMCMESSFLSEQRAPAI